MAKKNFKIVENFSIGSWYIFKELQSVHGGFGIGIGNRFWKNQI